MKQIIRSSILALALFTATFATPKRAEALDFGVSAPITIISGTSFWTAYFTFLQPIDQGISVGLDTGLRYHTDPATYTLQIPALATGFYDIPIDSPDFHPFVGLGAGIVISVVDIHNQPSMEQANVAFEGLLHLGCRFGEARHLFADFRLGVIDGNFAFSPTAGWFF